MKIPRQYRPVMPYLIVENAWALLNFAKQVFGATEQLVTEMDDGKVRHGEMRIHDAVIMFGESGPQWPPKPAAMFLYVDNVNAVHARALHLEAVELEPPGKKDYGYTSSFQDVHGNMWFIAQAEE
jgi:PhnB protein